MTQQLQVELDNILIKVVKSSIRTFMPQLYRKTIYCSIRDMAFALADGISSSNVSHIASQTAVTGLLSDYFSTPETWTVKTSVERVLTAINGWLYAQTQQSQYRFDKDRGYVCTLSAMVLKGQIAHLFHIGDSRIYRLQSGQLNN